MARVAFVQSELRDRAGIMALSAFLKHSGQNECEVFVLQQSNDLLEEVLAYEPTVVALSCMSGEHIWGKMFARQIKTAKPSQFVIMGGVHPTIYPEIIEESNYLDAICRGEGEYSFLEFLECFESGKNFSNIPNLWVRNGTKIVRNEIRPLIADLNSLPYMDRDIYYDKFTTLRDNPTKTFYVGRGCPHHCSYCHNHIMMRLYRGKGRYVRHRSVEHIIGEMKEVKKKYGYDWIQFNDDTLNVKKAWLMKLMQYLESEIRVGFICNVRVDHLDDEMIERMVRSGCDRVNIGVEHGDYQIRRDLLKRNIQDEQIIKIGRAFSDRGVRVFTSNLIGLPGETLEDAWKTVKLNHAMRTTFSVAFILEPYPRSAIYDYCQEHNLLCSDYGWDSLNDPAGTFTYTSKAMRKQGFAINQPQMRQLANMKEFFDLLVHYPWVWPIVRLLIKLPHNRIFNLIWQWPVMKFKIKFARDIKERINISLRIIEHLVTGRGA